MAQDPTTAAAQVFEIIAPGTATRRPMLTIVAHEHKRFLGKRLALSDGPSIVLGRNASVLGDGAFDDPKISRRHLALECRRGTVTVTDLQSRNGSYKNGERLVEERLQPGDVLTLGGVMLLFHWSERIPASVKNEDLVAASAAMARVLTQVSMVAHRSVTVLVQGSTGVGKEVIAREIHKQSGRSGAFVAVNCGAIGDGVLHSELFGHCRGAFSGADQERDGLVDEAHGGTLFLDEIGDASSTMQASLLRLLEQREYRRVGDSKLLTTDARFIAATHVPLEGRVSRGEFREDLFSRLSRWGIMVPPLRERPDDIVPLALHFAMQHVGEEAKLSPELTLALLRYDWPANVRELAAVIEQAVIESGSDATVHLSEAVAERLRQRMPEPPSSIPEPAASLPSAPPSKADVQRPTADELTEKFIAANGNMRRLATSVGVNRSTLYRWVEELGLDIRALRNTQKGNTLK
ncbi:MAG TPA: sigma 54-interacting transcriptional regulator [Polyangiaceae bacterium]|nr:sigma 54-interacting transcriptional regulator [Polyangiaceae bacterium]